MSKTGGEGRPQGAKLLNLSDFRIFQTDSKDLIAVLLPSSGMEPFCRYRADAPRIPVLTMIKRELLK
jgi:hypothetical protein